MPTTQTEPMSTDTMTDEAITTAANAFDRTVRSDGHYFNAPYLWKTALELQQNPEITGDAYLVALALASLTKVPRYGCRCTHKQIADRATALKKFMAVANRVGWKRVFEVLNIEQ